MDIYLQLFQSMNQRYITEFNMDESVDYEEKKI